MIAAALCSCCRLVASVAERMGADVAVIAARERSPRTRSSGSSIVRRARVPPYAGSVGAVARAVHRRGHAHRRVACGAARRRSSRAIARARRRTSRSILALAWQRQWPCVAPAAVVPAWLAADAWHDDHPAPATGSSALALAAALYAVFVAYPFVLDRRARDSRDPYLTAVAGSVFFFFAGAKRAPARRPAAGTSASCRWPKAS